jgi:hypothetical protein
MWGLFVLWEWQVKAGTEVSRTCSPTSARVPYFLFSGEIIPLWIKQKFRRAEMKSLIMKRETEEKLQNVCLVVFSWQV